MKSSKLRVFSGIQPTGEVHIGNYFGAIKNWRTLTTPYDCFFCIVDYHAMTMPYNAQQIESAILETAATLMACGLTLDTCTLFCQSSVMEHTELAWILSTLSPIGMLERMTQFKDKSAQTPDSINTGLLTYPVLQAADILLYHAEIVPVGEDQAQHLELTRELARKFNNRFGETFKEPHTLLSKVPRILGLDGQAKMSKSKGNTISLIESSESAWKKLSTAVTDPARVKRTDPGNPDICNIMTIHKCITPDDERMACDAGCRTAGIGCIDCKKVLFKHLEKEIAPIREKTLDLLKKPDAIREQLAEGGKRAKKAAQKTMEEVYKKTGIPKFGR